MSIFTKLSIIISKLSLTASGILWSADDFANSLYLDQTECLVCSEYKQFDAPMVFLNEFFNNKKLNSADIYKLCKKGEELKGVWLKVGSCLLFSKS